ncbi:MAG: hypothetical protein ACRCX2_33890 [Paraclostridium sp.]
MIKMNIVEEFTSRDEAKEYLSSFTLKELKSLAKEEDINLIRSNKDAVIDAIVQRAIGMKLAFNAIRSLDLSVKSRNK